jgi:hypothetical protein
MDRCFITCSPERAASIKEMMLNILNTSNYEKNNFIIDLHGQRWFYVRANRRSGLRPVGQRYCRKKQIYRYILYQPK